MQGIIQTLFHSIVSVTIFDKKPWVIYTFFCIDSYSSGFKLHMSDSKTNTSSQNLSIMFAVVVVQLLFSPILCDPMDCRTPGSSAFQYLPDFAQIHVYWSHNAIQLSHPSLAAFNLSQHHVLPIPCLLLHSKLLEHIFSLLQQHHPLILCISTTLCFFFFFFLVCRYICVPFSAVSDHCNPGSLNG